jgi:glutathione S-transferase
MFNRYFTDNLFRVEAQPNLPVLYSFRRCPYAMRARMALLLAGVAVELIEIDFRHKPQDMLDHSPKGTVPVLILPDGQVLEESLDIMRWALSQNDPDQLWTESTEQQQLIVENDGDFKYFLDRYKYSVRYPEHSEAYYREQGEVFLAKLEGLLTLQAYVGGRQPSYVDVAIMPFVRQFAMSDKGWFDQSPYVHLRRWLEDFMNSALFVQTMKKRP